MCNSDTYIYTWKKAVLTMLLVFCFSFPHPLPTQLPFKLPKLRLVFAAQSDPGADLDQFA